MAENTTSEYGYLIVNVRAARGAIPIAGAMITVYDSSDGERVIGIYYTGEDGATEKISLAAPPKGLSEEPGNGNVYASYNIESVKDGYYAVNNLYVPIFSGITSVQQVDMIPTAPRETPYPDIFFDETNQNRL